jgi:hypothetical protein
MDVSGQLHAAAALLPGGKNRYPLVRRLGGLQIWNIFIRRKFTNTATA